MVLMLLNLNFTRCAFNSKYQTGFTSNTAVWEIQRWSIITGKKWHFQHDQGGRFYFTSEQISSNFRNNLILLVHCFPPLNWFFFWQIKNIFRIKLIKNSVLVEDKRVSTPPQKYTRKTKEHLNSEKSTSQQLNTKRKEVSERSPEFN